MPVHLGQVPIQLLGEAARLLLYALYLQFLLVQPLLGEAACLLLLYVIGSCSELCRTRCRAACAWLCPVWCCTRGVLLAGALSICPRWYVLLQQHIHHVHDSLFSCCSVTATNGHFATSHTCSRARVTAVKKKAPPQALLMPEVPGKSHRGCQSP